MSTLRVASYNLYLGADLTLVFGATSAEHLTRQARLVHAQLRATDFGQRAAAVARVLVREQVDVVGLQEVARWTATSSSRGVPEVRLDFLPTLLAAAEAEGASYAVHAVNANFEGGARLGGDESMSVLGHNVVLVRRGSGVHVEGERTGGFAAAWSVRTGMSDLAIIVRRGWGWVDAALDGRPFRFVNTHLEAYDETVRDAQRDELLAAVGDPGRPVVLVGDFNAVPERVGVPAPYRDAWVVAGGPGPGHTCGQAAGLVNPESALAQRIDYVFVRDAEVTDCRVVGDGPGDRTPSGLWPSDHAGVVADLRV